MHAPQPDVRKLSSGYKFEHQPSETSVRLDHQGRWVSYRCDSGFYRRCMNGDIVCDKGETLLSPAEKTGLINKVAETLNSWSQSWEGCARIKSLLVTAGKLDFDYFQGLAILYKDTYPEGVPILPPDRYGDLVVQPVVGCPNRACTFCAFYKDKPYKMLLADQFSRHLQGVRMLFGEGLLARDGLFVGSANAMALSQRRLLNYLEQIHGELGEFKRGIAAFADPDFSAPRSTEQWQELANLGFDRLVVGLETGWGTLRGKLGKSADLSKVQQAVYDYKRAGIGVGITVLAGASEPASQQGNVQRTARFVKTLELERQDIVYLSPLESASVDKKQRAREFHQLKEKLSACTVAKVIPYQMQRFRYYC
ncbi:hypothetical protein GZ77_08335 [Endozoicomonas montiporae]|uniref:Radical SAM core domain-containing protein n=2 Tax=Endozoicomonas montiporae TaxID=1027273 RepID=A0A081N7F8_9GAMM|nr:radical SAM protein [Endozoicomonas montiporae]AMO55777.1 Fe-S oxidoreductase [Endozoicomonas montiporae CL-33]KEQ14381.1 hypothetical protein GZ77_08335 [Endozoicomonas montiporae]